MPESLPTVHLILTGGTFDAIAVDRLDLSSYAASDHRLNPQDIIDRVPEVRQLARITALVQSRKWGSAIDPADWLALWDTLRQVRASEPTSAVVITHGTNTLEETAYFLSLTTPARPPIVVVGAMRPASGIGTDMDLNLLNAVRTAIAPPISGLGVVVVLNETIHSPRYVTKRATFRLNAFESPDTGPIGYADTDGEIVMYMMPTRRPPRTPAFSLEGIAALPRVDIVASYPGQDGAMIDSAVVAGTRGIVSAGTGSGQCTALELAAYERAIAQGVAVVQSTRVGSGRVAATEGLRRRGIMTADNLNPWKARVLLMLALTVTTDPAQIQEMFDTF